MLGKTASVISREGQRDNFDRLAERHNIEERRGTLG